MDDKSTVSTLHEYCAKNKYPQPTYEYLETEEEGFICKMELLDISAHGVGRSKRDAKHVAALNLLKEMRIDIQLAQDEDELPVTDMITKLRDYCVQMNHPLPIFDIVQQGGTPDAPKFTALCAIASIRRYGISDKKKDAKQKAAKEMLRCIMDNSKVGKDMQAAKLEASMEEIEEERYQKFKTYRELTNSKTGKVPGIKLCDRHNFFVNFYPDLKQKAFEVLDNKDYHTDKEKALDILHALKINPNISTIPSVNSIQQMLLISLDCEYDVVFIDYEEKIYRKIIEYFEAMLVP